MQRHALNSVAIGNFKLFGWNKSNKNDKQKRSGQENKNQNQFKKYKTTTRILHGYLYIYI